MVDIASGTAELARGEASLELDVLGPEAEHEPDHEKAATRLGGRADRVGLLERQCDRFLKKDMLARSERRFGELAMVRCRQADVDRVHPGSLTAACRSSESAGADRRRDPRGPRAPPRRERLHAHATPRDPVVRRV